MLAQQEKIFTDVQPAEEISSQQAYLFLNFLCVVGLCASAITANKIVLIGGITFPCSNIIFSLLTFPVTDIISEIWGKSYAKKTVWVGFLGQCLFVGLIQVSLWVPSAPAWPNDAAYKAILSTTPRILLASMVAFLSAQMTDVIIFSKLKRMTGGRFLWLRNNVSTFMGQVVNSVLLITIAFYGVYPIGPLIVGSIGLKWLIALIDTPLVYYGVYAINKHLKGATLAYTDDE